MRTTSTTRGVGRGRRHRPGRRALLGALLLGLAGSAGFQAACAPAADVPPDTGAGAPAPSSPLQEARAALPGIDVLLRDSLELVRGKRVGLLTNHTGVSTLFPAGVSDTIPSSVEVLYAHPEVELVALFAPEHGLSGTAREGELIPSGTHQGTGLPIYSLYTETLRPLPHMLEGLDVLLFDIQDIGARYYTYVSTMSLAMEAAGEAGIPFIVLDRPNPVGGLVQGNVLEPDHSSLVGLHPVPMRHGMTPGELARLFRGAFGVEAELHVVPVAGWTNDEWYDETGLPWTPPSPNMPSLESATHYPGTCLFEGTNLSVGRGTERAFQWVGAPWLDGEALALALNAYGLPGVRFEPATFTPRRASDGKWNDEVVHGVRFVATDRGVYDPTRAAVAALIEARRMSGARWEWRSAHFDRLAGTERLRLAIDEGDSLEEATAGWDEQLAAFRELAEPYRMYR